MGSVCKSVGALFNLAIKISPKKPPDPPDPRHVELAAALWEQFNESDSARLKEFTAIVDFLTCAPADVDTSRSQWFLSFLLSSLLVSEESREREFAETVLMTLAERSGCGPKNTRIRTCQLLASTVQELPEGVELAEELAALIQEKLVARLNDVEPQVRLESIKGVERFQSEVEEEGGVDEVTQAILDMARYDRVAKVRAAALDALPITKETVELIWERTRDQAVYVQAMAYNIIAVKVDPRSIEHSTRMKIAKRGLSDQSSGAFSVFTKMIRSWYVDWCGCDLVRFLGVLDLAEWEQVSEDTIKHLLDNEVITSHQLESALKQDGIFTRNESLNEQWVFLWRVVCCWMKAKWRKGTENGDFEGEVQIEQYVSLLEVLFPPVEDLIVCIKNHMASGLLFQARQMVAAAADCINFSDASHRKAMDEVTKGLFSVDADGVWYQRVVSLAKAVWPDCLDFMLNTLDAVERSLGDDSEALSKCCRLSHVLKVLPRGIELPRMHSNLAETAMQAIVFAADSDECPVSTIIAALQVLSLLSIVFGPNQKVVSKLLDSVKSEDEEIRIEALKGLTDIAMTYGVHKTNEYMPTTKNSSIISLILDNIPLHRGGSDGDDSEEVEILLAFHAQAIRSLSQLVYLNESWNLQGMSKSTELACIIRLLTVLCTKCFCDAPEVDEILGIFFEKLASQSASRQRSLQQVFLPAVRSCLEYSDQTSACQAVNLLSNLLRLPVTKNSQESTSVAAGHAQLACLLLWEYVHSTQDGAEKTYTSSLWRALSSLQLDDCSVGEAQIFASLVEHWLCEGSLKRAQGEELNSRVVGKLAETDPLSIEEMDEVLQRLKANVEKASKFAVDIEFDLFSSLQGDDQEALEIELEDNNA